MLFIRVMSVADKDDGWGNALNCVCVVINKDGLNGLGKQGAGCGPCVCQMSEWEEKKRSSSRKYTSSRADESRALPVDKGEAIAPELNGAATGF